MSTPTDHSKLSISVLETNLNRLVAKMDDLEFEDATKNAATITKIKNKIVEYQNALDAKTSESKLEPNGATFSVAPQSANQLGSAEAKFNYNSMVSHIKSNVPTLAPPLDVSVFIQRLDNCYHLFVKPFKYLEPYFIQQAKSQLSSDILENLNASTDNTDDFENFKTYLKKNYGSKQTPFQIMGELLESAPKDGERLQEWTARQERRSDIVATQIISKFNEHQQKLGKPDMTVKDSFNLFCSMVTYDYIRKNKPDCFKLMIKEVDTCWKPTEVGSLAATLVDRIDKIDPDPAAHPAYSARQNQPQSQPKKRNDKKSSKPKNKNSKNEICIMHLHNMCTYGNQCRRKHLNPGDKAFDDALESAKRGKKNTNSQKSTPNTNVATTNSTTEELQPELVGMDIFGLHGGSKN